MRVIAGKYKDLKIQTIDKTTTRPIMSKMKESIFSSLQSELYDAEVLDLFAGSGSLGLESLSRGAASCVFVEISKEAIEVINIGRNRRRPASKMASMALMPWSCSSLANSTINMAFLVASPTSTIKPI